jgi:hypothetical protein
MNISDWVQIGSTLILGGIALFGFVITEFFKRRFFVPRLEVQYKNEPPYCVKTEFTSPEDPNLHEPVYYYRLILRNHGKSVAAQCEAVLEEIWQYDVSDSPKQVRIIDAQNLPIGEGFNKNVKPNHDVKIGFFHLSSKAFQDKSERRAFTSVPGKNTADLCIKLEQKGVPNTQVNCLAPGKYGLRINIYSDNTPPLSIYLQVIWSGKWQDNEDDLHQELVVKKVANL